MKGTKERYDYIFKVIIIGDSGVGKTNIILRFSDEQFKENYVATIGVDFKMKTLTLGDKKVRLQIWDTAGQERFRTITQTYYKGAAGIILTYSINDRQTFDNISKWMKQIKQKTPSNVQKLILANKADLPESQRQVSKQEGLQLAQSLSESGCKVEFQEVSAKTGYNITNAFNIICEQIKQYNQTHLTYNNGHKNQVIRIMTPEGKTCAC